MSTTLQILGLVMLMASSAVLLLTQRWRLQMGALALQYAGAFLLMMPGWSAGLSAVPMITGWIAAAILSSAHSEAEGGEDGGGLRGRVFKALVIGFTWVIVLTSSTQVGKFIPAPFLSIAGGLGMVCVGLLHLGMTNQMMKTIIGLLLVLSGFEILYAPLESAVLVVGGVAAVQLGLAILGAAYTSSNNRELST